MKKFLASLLLIIPLVAFAEEDFGIKVPQWKDFAPTAYIDVKEPKGVMGKLNVTAKYWYDRKVAFEEELINCKVIEAHEERFSCYEDLKVKQFRENTDYNARIEARNMDNGGIPEMYDRTDSMLPVGNYLNSFSRMMPNEIRGY
jgi:hypothetical protein